MLGFVQRLNRGPVRFAAERDGRGLLLRMWWRWTECAYIMFAVRGLQAEIELPSDWHEHRMGWVRIGLGFMTIAFAFPWKWTVPDEGQCSGPRYGFAFHGSALWIHFGKMTGKSRGPKRYRAIDMPWAWHHREHEVLSEPETHHYTYTLRSGEVQPRNATHDPSPHGGGTAVHMTLKWLDRDTVHGPYMALCLTEKAFLAAARHCKVPVAPGEWLDLARHTAVAHTWEKDGKLMCVVCVHPDAQKADPIEVACHLVHESVHIFQRLCDSIGETSPSREFEAYSIERIAGRLMRDFVRQTP